MPEGNQSNKEYWRYNSSSLGRKVSSIIIINQSLFVKNHQSETGGMNMCYHIAWFLSISKIPSIFDDHQESIIPEILGIPAMYGFSLLNHYYLKTTIFKFPKIA